MKKTEGYSLLELMVVLAIFSIIAVITTQTLLVTLKNARKSDISANVRSNVDFVMATLERHLRNAVNLTCPNPDPDILEYEDQFGNPASFSCTSIGNNGYIASGSARLTSDEVTITSCEFVCIPQDTGSPPSITINIQARDSQATAFEQAIFNTSTTIYTRSY